VLPVIEVGEAGIATGTPEEISPTLPFPGISFSLEKAVPMESGYLLQGMLAWSEEYEYITFPSYSLEDHLPLRAADRGRTSIPGERH